MVTHTIRMKEMPEDERPYEKCIRYGAASLTDVELFAVLLQTGTKGKSALDLSREILTDENGKISLKKFRQMDYKDFCRVKGIGPVKAVQLSSLNELTKRLSKMQYARQPRFTSPEEIASFFMEDLRHEQQENLKSTQREFENVNAGIKDTRNQSGMVDVQAKDCDESRSGVIDIISNLSAISEQNAASTQETTASIEDLTTAINLVAQQATQVQGQAEILEEAMRFFKM